MTGFLGQSRLVYIGSVLFLPQLIDELFRFAKELFGLWARVIFQPFAFELDFKAYVKRRLSVDICEDRYFKSHCTLNVFCEDPHQLLL